MTDIHEERRGNFVAVTTDEAQINNWHTAIYEDDYKGLLIAMCNQNGRYPWQARAILAGLNAKNEATELFAALQDLLSDCEEYSRINNLHNEDGSPASNHAMRRAREALSKANPTTRRAAQ
jgi:hypothetical protein